MHSFAIKKEKEVLHCLEQSEGGLYLKLSSWLVIRRGLESIQDREVCCYMISCKDSVNIDAVIDWLIKHSKTAK